jgi:hypothetical protein
MTIQHVITLSSKDLAQLSRVLASYEVYDPGTRQGKVEEDSMKRICSQLGIKR